MNRKIASACLLIFASFFVMPPVDAQTHGKTARPNQFDFSTRLLARTYAPGLSVNPEIGYAQKIWGDTTTPWFGFVRPSAIGVVSPTLSESKIGIEIFPVSILGADLRRTFSRRFSTTKNQDCTILQCMGDLNYTDLSFQTYFGHQDYFGSVRWTRTFFDAVADRTRHVYEVGASVLINPDGDAGDFVTVVVGKNLADKVSAGILAQVSDFRSSGNHQDGQYFFLRTDCSGFGLDDLEATLGIGRFSSSRNIGDVSGLLFLTYTHTRAIGFGR